MQKFIFGGKNFEIYFPNSMTFTHLLKHFSYRIIRINLESRFTCHFHDFPLLSSHLTFEDFARACQLLSSCVT